MAFASTTEWEVRTTGSDSNGGGFNTASTGTDYSQQDSPQVTYTDLVIGASVTQLTSASNPFTSAHVGNIINITGGTGFTVQRVQIVTVSGGVASCDKSCGTASSTGGVGSLGGGLLTVATAGAIVTATNKIHIKAGTYITTAITPLANPCSLIGYQTTHNDGGTRPLITTATNSIKLFQCNSGTTAVWYIVSNINFSNTATTRSYGIDSNSVSNPNLLVSNATFDGFSLAIAGSSLVDSAFTRTQLVRVTIKNSTVAPWYLSGDLYMEDCFVFSNTCGTTQTSQNTSIVRSVFYSNTGYGLPQITGAAFIQNCVFRDNTSHGVDCNSTSSIQIANSIFYGNGGYGVAVQTTPAAYFLCNNAYRNNTSGNLQTPLTDGSAVSLTAECFTAPTSSDFSLNSTAGGGAACKGAGFPGAALFGTGHIDIGAVQSGSSGGGSGSGGSWTYS